MAYLFDTNSLIYYYRGSPGAQAVESILLSPPSRPFYISSLTILEVRATFFKLARSLDEPDFTLADCKLVLRRFAHDHSSLGPFRVKPLRKTFVEHCSTLVEQHGLNEGRSLLTLDAMQLSVAIDLSHQFDLVWISADRALRGIGQAQGIKTLNPCSS